MRRDRSAGLNRLGVWLSVLPGYPGTLLFVTGLNLIVAQHLPPDVRHQLAGKSLRIRVTDAQLVFDFAWRQSRFAPCRHAGEPDLTIAASLRDFLLLAQRKEDPDTLFFSRRLAMQGDTELGLLIKNTLDGIDAALLDPARFGPTQVFERCKRAFQR